MLSLLSQTLQPLYSPVRTSLLMVDGKAAYDHSPLRLGYVGSRINLQYLQDLFFSESELVELSTAKYPFLLGAQVQQAFPEVDLYVTDMPRLWHPVTGLKSDMTLPAWVRQVIQFDLDAPPGQRLMPRSTEREIERHTRREQYSMDICSDASTLTEFFHQFYLPHVTARFGKQAVVVAESRFRDIGRNQKLARLFSRKCWVAGMLIHESPRQLKFGWYGSRGDATPPGAAEALDGFCIRNARSIGIPRVLLGNSRPSLKDGVLRYKAKFGARISPTTFPQSQLGIRVCNWSNSALVHHINSLQLLSEHAGLCHVCELIPETSAHTLAGKVHLRPLQ